MGLVGVRRNGRGVPRREPGLSDPAIGYLRSSHARRRTCVGARMTVPTPPGLLSILGQLTAAGFTCLVVGGAVRDSLLGVEPVDFDVEVYGISYERLTEFLGRHGRVDLVGKSFGVVKFGDGWDFSVPRRDNKIGAGHRDFGSSFDPAITLRAAASRG